MNVLVGRESVNGYEDCYKILVLPNNGRSKMLFYYHPQISSVGWAKLELTLLKIPVVSSYEIKSNLKD